MNLSKAKITALLIALILVVSSGAVFASGSGQSSGSGAAPVFTVKVWGGVPAESGPQAVIDAFNAEFKDRGIQAEYTRFVNDTNGNLQLETNLLSGDSVDVYMNYSPVTLNKRVESNMALDQTSLIARDNFDIAGFGQANLDQWYINGKVYGLPTTSGTGSCILINKNMFDAAGIPIPTEWTYSEFREIAKRLTKGEGANKVYGVFFNTGQFISAPLFHSFSLKPDWQYGPNNRSSRYNQEPAVKEALQFAVNVMNIDGSAPTHADTVSQKLTQEGMFLSGRAAITIGAWIVRNIKDTANFPHDFVTAFVPYPVSDLYPALSNPGGTSGDAMAINPKSKNIDACWEYIKWYSTKGIISMAAGGRLGLYAGLDQTALTSAFLAGGESLFDVPTTQSVYVAPKFNVAYNKITVKASELEVIWNESVEAVYNGRMSIEEALADCETRANRILAQ